MSDGGASVSTWLERLRDGDEEAAARLWDRYFRRLLGLARKRLAPLRRKGAADEEDVALSAFNDFCLAVRAEKFGGLRGRQGLWRLLATFVARKAGALLDREKAAKRGGNRVRGDSALGPSDSSGARGFGGVPSREPEPAWVVEMGEKFQRFFARLGAEEAEVARLEMEGYAVKEIAARVGRSQATVSRRLAVIRDLLAEELGDGAA
jgi:DNA-directed RNA polymerase specialized sigma24 family protein